MGRTLPRLFKIQSKDPILNRFQDEVIAAFNGLANTVFAGQPSSGGDNTAVRPPAPTDAAGWLEEVFTYPRPILLSRTPLRSSIMVFKNGILERGWFLNGRLLVLVSPLTSEDTDVVVRYQV